MKIAIITTGDEILQGIIADTNSAWLSEKCNALGHQVVWHSSVDDEAQNIVSALEIAAQKADTVFVSGGLGPTADDITLEVAAKSFGLEMIKDEQILATICERFERRNLTMTSSNEKQAYLPIGAKELPNTIGTAPGVEVVHEGTCYFFLPGVPNELCQIFNDSIAAKLQAAENVVEQVLLCFGKPEAEIDTMIQGVDLCDCRLSFRAKSPEVRLKLVARGENAQQSVGQAEKNLCAALGNIIYGAGESDIFAVVGNMLKEKNLKLAVAESCTGGYLASCITDVAGASDYFERGFVTYSDQAKIDELGVSLADLEKHGAVSAQIVEQMAVGLLQKTSADFSLALTGIAGPTGGTDKKPVGTVYLAIGERGKQTQVQHFIFSRGRTAFKQAAAWTAVDMLRKRLMLYNA